LIFEGEKCNTVHCKKELANFPSPAGMSLTKLSLVVNNQIIPGQGELSDIPAGDGKMANLFYSVADRTGPEGYAEYCQHRRH
jgi:hypothetical protein